MRATLAAILARSRSVAAMRSSRLRARSRARSGLRQTISRSPGKSGDATAATAQPNASARRRSRSQPSPTLSTFRRATASGRTSRCGCTIAASPGLPTPSRRSSRAMRTWWRSGRFGTTGYAFTRHFASRRLWPLACPRPSWIGRISLQRWTRTRRSRESAARTKKAPAEISNCDSTRRSDRGRLRLTRSSEGVVNGYSKAALRGRAELLRRRKTRLSSSWAASRESGPHGITPRSQDKSAANPPLTRIPSRGPLAARHLTCEIVDLNSLSR